MKLLPNILLVTANSFMLEECRRSILPMKWPLVEANNAHDALCELEKEHSPIDLLLVDLELPDTDGIALASEVTRKFSSIKRIMLAQNPNTKDLIRAINKGHVQNFFTLPLKRIQLHEAILHAFKTKQWDDERKQKENSLHSKYKDLRTRAKDLKSKAKVIQHQNRGLNTDLENRTEELHQTSLFIDAAQLDLTHAYAQTIEVFSGLLELHNSKRGRGKKISELAVVLAHELKLPPYEIQQISYAAQLVEASKVVLKDELVCKNSDEMNKQELNIFHKYPIIAESALDPLKHIHGAVQLLRGIEENVDGSGFPDHLEKHSIKLGSRMLRIIRDYMALLNGDKDGIKLDPAYALEALHSKEEILYDAELLEKIEQLLHQRLNKEASTGIDSTELQKEMIIAEDFFTYDYNLLLTQGTIIDDQIITKIMSYQQESGETLTLPIANSSLQKTGTG
ncbi:MULTISPECIES: HD domain-containing phosphohydrolase [unclassified Neptuniibacter]|uniref:HD domain-containing phosphohydrolase n=1 Tax=unclassified Neptuniibacter TaxID=2630693 RepID=UPI000C59E6D0|nr:MULTISPECIES: HD domain-containing phosphohydrolase [unclassified Neptuniibacter]MAY41847.1 hypothetical protein [Oceanospirillaceae bacterium]